jgi:hypothetical protein
LDISSFFSLFFLGAWNQSAPKNSSLLFFVGGVGLRGAGERERGTKNRKPKDFRRKKSQN